MWTIFYRWTVQGVSLFDELASYRVGSLLGDIIICRSDDPILGLETGGFQVFPDFLFDLRGNILLEKGEGFFAIFCDSVMRGIGAGVHSDQIGFHKLGDCLLEVEIIGIFPIQDKFRDL